MLERQEEEEEVALGRAQEGRWGKELAFMSVKILKSDDLRLTHREVLSDYRGSGDQECEYALSSWLACFSIFCHLPEPTAKGM